MLSNIQTQNDNTVTHNFFCSTFTEHRTTLIVQSWLSSDTSHKPVWYLHYSKIVPLQDQFQSLFEHAVGGAVLPYPIPDVAAGCCGALGISFASPIQYWGQRFGATFCCGITGPAQLITLIREASLRGEERTSVWRAPQQRLSLGQYQGGYLSVGIKRYRV